MVESIIKLEYPFAIPKSENVAAIQRKKKEKSSPFLTSPAHPSYVKPPVYIAFFGN